MKAVQALEGYIEKLRSAAPEIEEKLADIGVAEATPLFKNAEYAGTNDVVVQSYEVDEHAAVIAQGEAVAFLEFGAGVRKYTGYPQERPDGIADIGMYADDPPSQGITGKPWVYYGEQGTGGHPVKRKTKKGEVERAGVYMTSGNPPYAPMYHAANAMQNEAANIVKEVLGG